MNRSTLDPPTSNDNEEDDIFIAKANDTRVDAPPQPHRIPLHNTTTTTSPIPTTLVPRPHTTITTITSEHSKQQQQQQQQQHPKVGVGVVVMSSLPIPRNTTTEERHGIWVGRRCGSHGHHTLALPGGHLEMYESWSECAIREVQEEMGITLANVEFLHVTNDIMINDQKHYITIFMIGHYDADAMGLPMNCEPNKCDGWELCTLSQLRSMIGTKELFIPLEHLLIDNPPTLAHKFS